jgi:putative ABC transport system permease protein
MQLQENIRLSLRGLIDHKFRSFLTMLGIIFGVASVITMLSIGEGAKREAIAKYQDLGVNNIIIREKKMSDEELEEVRARFSRGLSIQDAEVIREIVPGVLNTASQAEISTEVRFADRSVKSTVIGITPAFIEMLNYKTDKGSFVNQDHYDRGLRVCVLGAGVATTLFKNAFYRNCWRTGSP